MADTQPYRPRQRGFETLRDMLWSLVPIVVLVIAFVYFCGPSEVTRVDPSSDISSAAREVDYPLHAPQALTDDWAPSSSVLVRADDEDRTVIGLSIGYVTPEDEYARFVISAESRDATLQRALGEAEVVTDPDGVAADMGQHSWVPVRTTTGRALVAEGSGYVVVVTGTASYEELRELAGAVQPIEVVTY